MNAPIFLVRWKLRRMGYWLIRSHCSCRPACYFIDGPNGHVTSDLRPETVRKNAVAWVKDHFETQIRMGLIDWRDTHAGRRERARWETQRDAARRYGGQHSPWGVVRPPLVTTRQETPPPPTGGSGDSERPRPPAAPEGW